LASKKRFGREKNKMSTCGVWTHFWYPNGPLGFDICSEKQQQTQQQKVKQQQSSFGVLSLAPATWTRKLNVSEAGQKSA